MVFVQVRFTLTASTSEFFNGLPIPLQSTGNQLIELTHSNNANGAIVVNAAGVLRGETLSSGTYNCTGSYICR